MSHFVDELESGGTSLLADVAAERTETKDEEPGLFAELWESRIWRMYPLLVLEVAQAGALYPILPGLTMDFFARQHNAGQYMSPACASYRDPHLLPDPCKAGNADAAFVSGVVAAVGGFLTFLTSPLLGRLADSYGRKPFLYATQLTSALPTLLLLGYHYGLMSLWPYFVTNAVSGAASTMAILLAYIADTCSPGNRAPAFGLLLATFSIAILGTPVLAAFLSNAQLFALAAASGFFSVLYMIVLLPETLPPSRRQPFTRDGLNPVSNLSILFSTRLFRRLTACVMFDAFATQGVIGLLPYYLQQVLGFGKNEISFILVSFGVSGFLSNAFLLKLLSSLMSDKYILVIGVATSAIDKLVTGFARSAWMVYASIFLFGGPASVSFPAVSAIKSNNVDAKSQGQIQGALYGARSLASAAGPLVFSAVFSLFGHSHGSLPAVPSSPFFLACALELTAVAIAYTVPDSGKAEDLLTPRPHRSPGDDSPGSYSPVSGVSDARSEAAPSSVA